MNTIFTSEIVIVSMSLQWWQQKLPYLISYLISQQMFNKWKAMAFKKEKQNMHKTLIGLKGFTDRRKKKNLATTKFILWYTAYIIINKQIQNPYPHNPCRFCPLWESCLMIKSLELTQQGSD